MNGYDIWRHEALFVRLGWLVGQVMVPGNDAIRFDVCRIATSPAAWFVEVVTGLLQPAPELGLHPGGGTLPSGACSVLNKTPAEAVVSFATTVLLMKSTFKASCREIPPPSQP